MENTATAAIIADLEKGRKLYLADRRARLIVDASVAQALNECREPTDYDYKRFARDVATEAAAALLRYIYENDGEINRLAVERDHYKRLAEGGLRFMPPTIAIASITNA